MAQRICFLGRGGSGKSTVAQNLGHALALKGYHVLLVGNDISLSSTVLLRGEADISPALEDYREHYEIDLNDYVIPTPSGVYCLELGSIAWPAASRSLMRCWILRASPIPCSSTSSSMISPGKRPARATSFPSARA